MSNLPSLTTNKQVLTLPAHRELLDQSAPFNTSSHKFRPAKQITELVKNYALALVDQVEKIASLKYEKPANERAHKTVSRLSNWTSSQNQHGIDQRWNVVRDLSENPDDLRYVMAASKHDGSWEKFTVHKNINEDAFTKAIWKINGFLPGELEFDMKTGELALPNPGLMQLAEINTRFVNQKFGMASYRIHDVLTKQAQWLVDLKKTLKLNGNGIKVGDYKFSVTQRNAVDDRGTTLSLYKGKKGDETEAFIVQLDTNKEIKEIRHLSLRSNTTVRLVRHNGVSIFEKAELGVFDKSEAQKVLDHSKEQKSIREFFEACRDQKMMDTIDSRLIALDKAFFNCEKTEILNLHEAAEAQNDFWLKGNLLEMADKNALISRPERGKDLPKPLSDVFQDFYSYTKIKPKQVSLSFFSGGIARTKLTKVNGESFQLQALGPVHIRRQVVSDENDQRVSDSQFKELLGKLEIDVTTEEQDKALLRWVLINNKERLKEIGILLETNSDNPNKPTIHFLCPERKKEALWAIKLEVPTAYGQVTELPFHDFLQSYIFKDLVDAENKKYIDHAVASGKKVIPKVFNVKMNILDDALKRVGFHLANRVETESYLHQELEHEGDSGIIHDFVDSKIETYGNFYKNQFAVSATAVYLKNQGYQNIEVYKANPKAASYVSCEKNGEVYLFRPVIKSKSRSYAIRDTLIKDAQKILKKPYILMLDEVDFHKRTVGSFETLAF